MRRLTRPPLEPALQGYLDRMQDRIPASQDIAALWRAQRKTIRMKAVARVLAAITGRRERCMYCEDSRGTDIEHFRPKNFYRDYVFRWSNLLWICAACNRAKGARFPCDVEGVPLLIDPTAEEPWAYLVFDPDTGEITARWEVSTGRENPRGLAVLAVLDSSLRHQAVTEGRKRTTLRLRRDVRSFLKEAGPIKMDIPHEGVQALLEAIEDATDFGIAAWFFLSDGQNDPPFGHLRSNFPKVWNLIVDRLCHE